MQTIPPVEKGYTFVQLPMWLWIENPLLNVHVENHNQVSGTRIEARAELVDVTWDIGDTTLTCTPGEMRTFEHGTSSITDKPPECMHRFTQLSNYTMTATARYKIEERISFRGHSSFAWPDTPWYEHPTTPFATISNQTGQMTVHEVVAVNVPIEQTNPNNTDAVAIIQGDE